ncbi:MAG: DNA mismatch repair protein MutS, partial [Euryarchaeota archaeon]|nr:DNA mismatch repair protein MutS [Euryarchaeota archaeon]
GGMFRDGWNDELDSLRQKASGGKDWIAEFEQEQRKQLLIPSLKVRYNRQIGWYIEVTKTHLEKVPEHYHRKQSMLNAQRFTTEELKSWEDIILNADSRCNDLEFRLFKELRSQAMSRARELSDIAIKVATVDVLACLADISRRRGWVRPELNENLGLDISEGRHPVLDMQDGFVPNDINFNPKRTFILITGPNMGGKSTYLRQTALITILAQMGCFVPAKKARIGIVDRIFTRVGASDDLKRGRSTFMMEMIEMAHILKRATPRSLLLLDEVGRGTSTFDGLSLAWAICEDITNRLKSRTLFATHYHQLVGLEDEAEGLVNVHVKVAEVDGGLRFLHKVGDGPCDDSFGIHVAALAGMQTHVVERARDLLVFLEQQAAGAKAGDGSQPGKRESGQKSIMGWMLPKDKTVEPLVQNPTPVITEAEKRALEHLAQIEPDHLSPKEALDALYRLRDLIQGRHELMQE